MGPEAHQQWNPSVQWAAEAYPLETLGARLVTGKLTVARAGDGPWTRGPRTGEWLWVYTLMIFGDYKYIVIVAGMNIGSCSKCIFFKTQICLLLISSFCQQETWLTAVSPSAPTTAFCAFRVFSVLRAYLWLYCDAQTSLHVLSIIMCSRLIHSLAQMWWFM